MAALPRFATDRNLRLTGAPTDLRVSSSGRWGEIHAKFSAALDEVRETTSTVDSMCDRAKWVLQQAVFELEELHRPAHEAAREVLDLEHELSCVAPFETLESSELASLAADLVVRTLPAGAAIEKLSESGEMAEILWEGSAFMADGEREHMLGPREWLDEAALITGEARRISAVATMPVKVLSIPRQSIATLARRHPAVSTYFLDLFMRRHPEGSDAWRDLPAACAW
jgi:hypothetical protein